MSELETAIQSGDDMRVLRIAKLPKNEKDAQMMHAQAIALIRLDKFNQAMQILNSLQGIDKEMAYCLYRLGELEKALTLVPNTSNLKAQIVCYSGEWLIL